MLCLLYYLQTMLDDLGKGLVSAHGLQGACCAMPVCMVAMCMHASESRCGQHAGMLLLPTPTACNADSSIGVCRSVHSAPRSSHPAPSPSPLPPSNAPQGPVFVAFFIERLGRTGAFNLSTLGWVPCGLLLLGTGAPGLPGQCSGACHMQSAGGCWAAAV